MAFASREAYRAYHREYQRNLRAAMSPEEREAWKAQRREWYAASPLKPPLSPEARAKATAARNAWRAANLEKDRERRRAHAEANKEKFRAKILAWKEANPGKMTASTGARRAAKYNATPKWLNEADHDRIMDFYRMAALIGLTVDHIVPLQGKAVCGLHVPWNMQLLTLSENISKGTRT